ncbi:MAG: helix-turn-helix domain-containing protein, partial [Candidatus Cryptobacteroides sp.]
DHSWPGNVRELQNCIETAVIMSDGPTLMPSDIAFAEAHPAEVPATDGECTLEMAEEQTIRAALKRFNGNLSMVAKSLDISRPTLYSKLKKYNI